MKGSPEVCKAETGLPEPAQKPQTGKPNEHTPYIGFDVHKKSISCGVKTADGKIVEEGRLRATHHTLREWAGKRPEPWHGAMEATRNGRWIADKSLLCDTPPVVVFRRSRPSRLFCRQNGPQTSRARLSWARRSVHS